MKDCVVRYVLLVISLSSLLGGSTTDAFGSTGLPTRKALVTRATCKPSTTIAKRTIVLYSSPEGEDDEDDGWGSPAAVEKSNFDRDRKVNELRYLREEASNKAESSSSSSMNTSEPERDMFIPIMAVVSLAGLFGAYGYETLRLASRGELYLPF